MNKTSRFKTFLSYVIPSIGAMIITSLYVVIDGIFVGQGVGSNALAAISIAGPYIMIIVALTLMVTVGGATLSAINMAKKDKAKANNYFSISVYTVLIFSLLITLITSFTSDYIVTLLGASEELKQDASTYLMWFVMFSVFFNMSNVLAAFVRNDNSPTLAFVGMLLGGLSNIFLDWLFIYPLNMGIMGSAIASGLGQIISCLILLSHFFMKKAQLKLTKVSKPFSNFKEIVKRGTPEFMNQLFQPVMVFCYNILAMHIFGEVGVSAFSVVYYILTIAVAIFIGLTQGTQPLISKSYGEGNISDEKYYYKTGLYLNIALSVLIYMFTAIFAKDIIKIFNNDPELIEIGYTCILYYGISFIFTSINIVIISYYTAKKKTMNALILSISRCLIFIPLCVFLSPVIFGSVGTWLGITFAEIFSLILSIFISKIDEHKEDKSLLKLIKMSN